MSPVRYLQGTPSIHSRVQLLGAEDHHCWPACGRLLFETEVSPEMISCGYRITICTTREADNPRTVGKQESQELQITTIIDLSSVSLDTCLEGVLHRLRCSFMVRQAPVKVAKLGSPGDKLAMRLSNQKQKQIKEQLAMQDCGVEATNSPTNKCQTFRTIPIPIDIQQSRLVKSNRTSFEGLSNINRPVNQHPMKYDKASRNNYSLWHDH